MHALDCQPINFRGHCRFGCKNGLGKPKKRVWTKKTAVMKKIVRTTKYGVGLGRKKAVWTKQRKRFVRSSKQCFFRKCFNQLERPLVTGDLKEMCLSSRFLLNYKDQNSPKSYQFSNKLKKRPNASEGFRMHPNVYECNRTGPNASEEVQTRPKTQNLQKLRKKCKTN